MTRYGDVVKYKCFNDCRQEGCPGHTMQAKLHTVSDVYSIEVDGEEWFLMDPSQWKALSRTMETIE